MAVDLPRNRLRRPGGAVPDGESDGQLLERFVASREEAAFAALLSRYGPTVLHVCRRVLPEPHDAEDVFQATFLLLLKQATSIRKRDSVGSWLYGTAYRLAVHLRRQSARRKQREQRPRDAEAAREPGYEAAWRELQAVLDEELARLPDRHRAPLLLCYFQGKTLEEAARQLGWPLGTVASRVARARDALRLRLERRGLVMPAILFGAALATRTASAAVPASLAKTTLAAGLAVAAGRPVSGLVSAQAAAVLEGAMVIMRTTKLLLSLAVLLSAGFALAFLAGPALVAQGEPPPAAARAKVGDPPAKDGDRAEARRGRDALGDPLPPGARCCLGTSRLFGAVGRPAFTPDSRAVVTSDARGALSFWDVASGRELRRLDPAPVQNREQAVPAQVAFTGDGGQVVSRHGDFEILVRDAVTGKLARKFGGQPNFGGFFALSPDGKYLAAPRAIIDRKTAVFKVLVWDVRTGESLPEFVVATLKSSPLFGFAEAGNVQSLALSPDGKYGAAGLGDGEIRLWEVATGKEVHRIVGHRVGVARVAFSPDGRTLASVSPDESVRLWDVATGNQTRNWQARGLRRLQEGGAQQYGLEFADDGRRLVLSGQAPARVWDVGTGEEVRLRGPELQSLVSAPVGQAVFQQWLSPDGKALATVQQGVQQGARLWLHDPATGAERHDFAGHLGPIQSAAVSPTGVIATGGADHTVRLWDGQTGRQLRVLRGHVSPVGLLAFSPDARLLASASAGFGGQDRVISIWDVSTGKEVRQIRGAHIPRGLAFLAGGKRLLVMGKETVWDIATGKQVREVEDLDSVRILSALTPDGRLMASCRIVVPREGGFDQAKVTIVLTDPVTGEEAGSFDPMLQGGARFMNQLALSPDGRTLLGRQGDRSEYTLWDTASGRMLRVVPRPGGLGGQDFFGVQRGAFFTPDGRLVIHASQQGKVHVLELASGQDRLAFEAGPAGPGSITALALSPDGKTLVTAGRDGTALVWDLAAPSPAARSVVTEEDLSALWAELIGEPPVAGQAIRALAAAPEKSVPYLAGKVRPAAAPDLARIERLIRDLDSKNYAARKGAEAELAGAGFAARPLLEKALKAKPSLEMTRRIETLLNKLETSPLPTETVRQLRALEVLELAGGPEARRLIESLAAGAEGEPLTAEARSAIERLKRRAG